MAIASIEILRSARALVRKPRLSLAERQYASFLGSQAAQEMESGGRLVVNPLRNLISIGNAEGHVPLHTGASLRWSQVAIIRRTIREQLLVKKSEKNIRSRTPYLSLVK